jgi:hypothetical protein
MVGLLLTILIYALNLFGWNISPLVPIGLFGSFSLKLVDIMAILIILVTAIAVSWYAKKRGQSFWVMLLLGVLISPGVQIIVLLILLGRGKSVQSVASRQQIGV